LFYFLYGIDGITGIVMSGASPARSRRLDVEIELMRSSELDGFVPAPVVAEAPRLVAGARVVILSGVLQGHIGVCEETRGRSASVLTNLFGRQTPAWHSEADLAVA
jgi:transcription antitermination factor NusG